MVKILRSHSQRVLVRSRKIKLKMIRNSVIINAARFMPPLPSTLIQTKRAAILHTTHRGEFRIYKQWIINTFLIGTWIHYRGIIYKKNTIMYKLNQNLSNLEQRVQQGLVLRCLHLCLAQSYPSISEKLLKDALNWAKSKIGVTEEEAKIVMNTKEALLFKDGKPWVKKGGKPFNVTMGSWDGAEVADLVGLFLLSKL